jgi:hypothetical protein
MYFTYTFAEKHLDECFFWQCVFLLVVVVGGGGVLTEGVCRDGSKIGRSNSSLEQPYPHPPPPKIKRERKKKNWNPCYHISTTWKLEVGTTVVGRLPGLAG